MSRHRGCALIVGGIAGVIGGCGSRAHDAPPPPVGAPPPPPAVVDAGLASVARPPAPPFAPLGAAAPVVRDADGLPVIDVVPGAASGAGAVRWLGGADEVLQYAHSEASDGARIYAAMNDRGHDLVVRDGVLTQDVLAARGAGPGGCVGAHAGALYLAAPATTARTQQVRTRLADGGVVVGVEAARAQTLWTVAPDGREAVRELPTHPEDRCYLVAGDGGTFVYGGFRLLTGDAGTITERDGLMGGRITIGRVGGPAYCFASCNAAERQANPPAVAQLTAALGCQQAEWSAHGDRVAGACRGKAVRYREGGAPEVIAIPPTEMIGSYDLAFTDRGDLVIGLDYAFARYLVWPASAARPSPVRTLGAGERIAHASPTVHVRGLTTAAPPSERAAVLLGATIGFGAGGSTLGYARRDRGGPRPYQAQRDRAAAVLGAGDLVVAGEAVVDRACGAYVRSPLGWEDEQINDWIPPTLPALSPRAVLRPATCTPLDAVSAVPGGPDLLLARRGDQLLAAWLPPPLPLPAGVDPRGPTPVRPPPQQRPRPGTGWSVVGAAAGVHGDDGVPAPGRDTAIASGSWQAGGAAVVEVGGDVAILVTPAGAVTIPAATRPMAVATDGTLHAWGALGARVVDCTATCRVLDPGVGVDVTAIVPRTRDQVILGFADGRVGAYAIPATGGDAVARHPLTDALDAALARRPR